MARKTQASAKTSKAGIAARAAMANRQEQPANNRTLGGQTASLANALFKSIKANPGTYSAGALAVISGGYAALAPHAKTPQPKVPQPKVPQANVPQAATPKVPDHIMKLDYSKGDDASSLEELAAAVKKEYKVTSNKLAKDPSQFKKGRIHVTGEDHRNPLLPGIPGGRGAVLLESEDPNRCLLPKYTEDSSNVCEHIDTGRAAIDNKITASLGSCLRSGQKLLDLMDPSVMNKLKAKVSSDQSVWSLLSSMSEYSAANFNQAFDASNNNKEKQALIDARDEFYQSIADNNEVVSSTANSRDKAMIEGATKVIKNLDDDAGAAIVVGDLHADPIAKKLAQEFPDRPVVRLKPKNV